VEWDRFVESRAEASIFHHPAWAAALTDAYGFEPVVLTHVDGDGRIQAGARFLAVRSWLTGRRLISMPFTDYCPVLARDEQAQGEYAAALVSWRRAGQHPRMEVHGELPETSGIHAVPQGVRHVLSLGRAPDELYRSLKGTQVDRSIRKAARSGVAVRFDSTHDAIRTYYRLHCSTRRRQGVPVQPRRFFDRLWERLIAQGYGTVAIAEHDGEAIAGAVFLGWNGHLIYKYGASNPDWWSLRPNHLLFWKVIERACEEGYEVLDFGKTEPENHGLREFKRRWGAEEVPLAYATATERSSGTQGRVPTRAVGTMIRRTPLAVGRAMGELLYEHFA
jgi:CelD/BcsL family acetyltransferase involved in cellulose biosynthesis